MRKIVVMAVAAALLILAGCSGTEKEASASAADAAKIVDTQVDIVNTQVDVVTTASIVNTTTDFQTAVSAEGSWIIAILEDLSFGEEIVIEGEFTRNDKLYRKLAFYAQDENRTVTDRFTVTAPRMIIRSPNTRIQSGTFIGDVYVEANGFHLVDGTVDGTIYFASQEYFDSFSADENSSVTGDTLVK